MTTKRKCEICGNEIDFKIEKETISFGWPATDPRWCMECIEKGLSWGMERYAEAIKQ